MSLGGGIKDQGVVLIYMNETLRTLFVRRKHDLILDTYHEKTYVTAAAFGSL